MAGSVGTVEYETYLMFYYKLFDNFIQNKKKKNFADKKKRECMLSAAGSNIIYTCRGNKKHCRVMQISPGRPRDFFRTPADKYFRRRRPQQ